MRKLDWQISKKGNPWVKLPGPTGPTLTIFRSYDKKTKKRGYRWCISRSAKEGPLYSKSLFDDVQQAKRAVVERLTQLEMERQCTTRSDAGGLQT